MRYRTLFDQSPDGILVINPATLLPLEFNDAVCRQLGYTRDEFAQLRISDYEAVERPEETRARIEKLLRDGQDCFETQHRTKSGDSRDVLVSVQKLVLDNQPVLHCVFRDITERKRAETAIHLNEARLNSLLDLSQQASSLAERDIIQFGLEEAIKLTHSQIGYFHFVNEDQNTIQLFTWSRETLKLCKAAADNHYPIAQAGVWADCARLRKPVIHNDYQSLPNKQGYPEGHSHLLRHMSVPVLDQDKVRMIIGVGNKDTGYDEADVRQLVLIANEVWKIVRRHRTEEQLKISEARLKEAERIAHLGNWDYDLAHDTFSCSDEAYRIFGCRPQEFIPTRKEFLNYVHPEDRARVQQAIDGALYRNQPYNIDYRIVTADGRDCSVHAQAEVTVDAGGNPRRMLGTLQDVTGRKQLEAQYLRAQRVESIGLLAGGIAHDLNNVLAPILMAVDLLREGTLDAELQKIIDIIDASAQRGSNIIRQVLTFARGVQGERMAVQSRHLIKETAAIARETFPKNIQIDIKTPSDLWAVTGDPTQLQQVLLNLFVNARDAMPDGGRLTLAARNFQVDESSAAAKPSANPGNYIVLQVSDTGTGIPAVIIDRIFEPFFTTKEQGKGTGLGLSTVLGIVRSHGGFVKVASPQGAGSTFEIYLPATTVEEAEEPTKEAALPHGKGEQILVVDDEASVRQITEEILRQNGYRVLIAVDGNDAIALFAEHEKSIDLIITDIMMPLMDGIALTRALRKLSPSLKIIASTGLAFGTTESDKKKELGKLGVSIFLTKPYKAETLLKAVHEALSSDAQRSLISIL